MPSTYEYQVAVGYTSWKGKGRGWSIGDILNRSFEWVKIEKRLGMLMLEMKRKQDWEGAVTMEEKFDFDSESC